MGRIRWWQPGPLRRVRFRNGANKTFENPWLVRRCLQPGHAQCQVVIHGHDKKAFTVDSPLAS